MQAVKDCPRPTSARELATFLGFVNFYHSHIGHMSSEAGVLYQAAKAETFQWDEQCEEAFQALKWRLLNSPLRAHSDFTKPFFCLQMLVHMGWVESSSNNKTESNARFAFSAEITLIRRKITVHTRKSSWPL